MAEPFTESELEEVRELLADREEGITATAATMKYRQVAKRLLATVEECDQEIARHHKDFARWEDMAEKGAAQLLKSKAWDLARSRASINTAAFMDAVLGECSMKASEYAMDLGRRMEAKCQIAATLNPEAAKAFQQVCNEIAADIPGLQAREHQPVEPYRGTFSYKGIVCAADNEPWPCTFMRENGKQDELGD